MKGNKMDRRVKYTRMVIKESFINLLEKKDISRITVKEICENADINRATFYVHYSDQYDLLRKIEDEFLENIKEHLGELDEKNNQNDAMLLAEKIFEYIKENAKVCKLLLSERGGLNFQKRVMMLVYDRLINELTDNSKVTKEEAEYVYLFTITGCVGVIQKWLDGDMKESARHMAEMVIKLTMGLINLYRAGDSSKPLKKTK
ncbi:TetR/AcrR family transcriptional regulator [Acetivibrio clariflavus]|uniref:TetR/AcrR family transcriptional regulator n=1 Tax=Acetivibrio clariflavus TaxID=288965 RepID=UPI0004B89F7A|nr:TetR-like C-terminal domain-containing protein [Acetivibrio clariflavus]